MQNDDHELRVLVMAPLGQDARAIGKGNFTPADRGELYAAAWACRASRNARIDSTKLPTSIVSGTRGMKGNRGIFFARCLIFMRGS